MPPTSLHGWRPCRLHRWRPSHLRPRPRSPHRVVSSGAPLGAPIDAGTVRYVFAVAMKYVRDEDAAWDVTQNALLAAHRHRDSFRGDSAYSTWLLSLIHI